MKKNRFVVFILSAAFLCCAFLIARTDNPLLDTKHLVTILMVMFGIYILFILPLRKGELEGVDQPPQTPHFQREGFYFFIALSITAQLIFLFMPAFFNDFWRYLWDGKMSLNGINPFEFFPWAIHDNPLTASLAQVPYWNDMFFKWTHTIYGPTLQGIFYLSNLLKQDSALMLKSFFFAANLGSLWIGTKLLRQLNKDTRLIALLALNPLFLFETLGSAHGEAIFIFFLLLTLFLFVKKKYIFTGISFGTLILTKFFPLLIAPLFLIHKHWWKGFIAAIATIIALYLPFVLTISNTSLLFESFKNFSSDWIMSPGLFDLVHTGLSYSTDDPTGLTKRILNAVTILGIIWIYRRYRKGENLFDSIWWIFLLLIIFSSVVFSWYILWLAALLPFIKHRWPTIILSLTFATQYLLIRFDGVEHNTFKYDMNGDILWHQLVVWLPFFIALVISQIVYRKKKSVLAFYARIPNKYIVGKTRVGKAIGNQAAANELARSLIMDALDSYTPKKYDSYDLVYFHKGSRGPFTHERVNEFIEQPDDTLPNNMKYIHERLAKKYDRVLIVGSDIPLISRKTIKESFASLKKSDVVINPVEDGGYGLIGLRKFVDLYTPIRNWKSRSSGYHLYDETKKLVEEQGLTLHVNETTFDIDTPNELRKLWDIITQDEILKPEYTYLKRTYAWLVSHKLQWS